MTSSKCCFLTCIQIPQEAGQVAWYSHLFENFLQFVVIHTVKGFGRVNEAEVKWRSRRTCSHLLWQLQNCNLLLNNCRLENVGSHQKKIPPRPRAKEKPQQDGRRVEIDFRVKPLAHQRRSEGSNKTCTHQDPGTPQRLSQNCAWVSPEKVWVSSGLPQGQGLWVQQTWVWHKPSWRRSPLTPP